MKYVFAFSRLLFSQLCLYCCLIVYFSGKMVHVSGTKVKVVKKKLTKFKRHESDRYAPHKKHMIRDYFTDTVV